MKILIRVIFLINAAVSASGKKCFAPVLCTEEDASYTEWMQVFPTLQSASQLTCPKIGPTEGQKVRKEYENPEILCENITKSFRAETNATLKEMNDNFSKLERQLNLTVVSLQTETDGKLTEMNESNLKFKQELKATVDALKTTKTQFDEINDKISGMTDKLNTAMRILEIGADCELVYNGKCFRAIVHNTEDVTFGIAETMCKNGWKLANIYSKHHYDRLVEYLRTKVAPRGYVGTWLGMTYNYNTRKIYLSGGSQLTEELPWYPSHPRNTKSFNKLNIRVVKDPWGKNQGMVDFPADVNVRRGALCEI